MGTLWCIGYTFGRCAVLGGVEVEKFYGCYEEGGEEAGVVCLEETAVVVDEEVDVVDRCRQVVEWDRLTDDKSLL